VPSRGIGALASCRSTAQAHTKWHPGNANGRDGVLGMVKGLAPKRAIDLPPMTKVVPDGQEAFASCVLLPNCGYRPVSTIRMHVNGGML
jgi:hypothetical protein